MTSCHPSRLASSQNDLELLHRAVGLGPVLASDIDNGSKRGGCAPFVRQPPQELGEERNLVTVGNTPMPSLDGIFAKLEGTNPCRQHQRSNRHLHSRPSLRFDLNAKAVLYADAGVQEYWVLNLVDRELVVFPDDGAYRDFRTYRSGDRVAPGAWQDVVIEVSDPFPSEERS